MAYNALSNGTSPAAAPATCPRDIAGASKKKKGNRSAKLKQCKLDARREQWLSQVKNKDSKATSMAASPTSTLSPLPLSRPRTPTGKKDSRRRLKEEHGDPALHESSGSESPTPSPTFSGFGSASREGRPARGFSIESSSRTISDAEIEDDEEEAENGPLDDWEAVADTLCFDHGGPFSIIKPDGAPASSQGAPDQAHAKPEPIKIPPRAWRSDDATRPRSLPSLSKQRSLMVVMEQQCGLSHPCGDLSTPCVCPICCEDLDVTDSSFLPCLCGFRLCLFCYKRILEVDERCPACRKKYDPMEGGATDSGGSNGGASLRLSRSRSMRSRS